MSFLTSLRRHLAQRAAYRRTVAELQAMPLNTALDLDIYRPEAPAIAWRAVYGRTA